MEPQQSQATQQEQTPQNTPQTNDITPQPTSDFSQNSPLTPAPQSVSITPKKSRKKLYIGIAVALVIIGGAAAYWFTNKKDDKPVANTNQTTQATNDTSKDVAKEAVVAEPTPYAFVYKDTTKVTNPVQIKPFDSTLSETSMSPTAKGYGVAVHGNYVTAVLSADEKTKSESLLLSTDAGKSFETIYTAKPSTDNTSLGEQIMSVIFSSDKKYIVFANILYNSGSTTQVKIYDIAAKTTKDAFTYTNNGVYLKNFDAAKGIIYYTVGCYNCDGANKPILYSQNITALKETVVFEDKTPNIIVTITPNKEATKLLLTKYNNNCEGPGGCKPYSVDEYDIAAKTSRNLVTVTTDNPPLAGYGENNEPYITNEGKLLVLKKDATTPSLVYEGTSPILTMHYIDSTTAIFITGTYQNGILYKFDRATNKLTELKKLSNNIQVYGVLTK